MHTGRAYGADAAGGDLAIWGGRQVPLAVAPAGVEVPLGVHRTRARFDADVVAHQLRCPVRARQPKRENGMQVFDVFVAVVAVRLEGRYQVRVSH